MCVNVTTLKVAGRVDLLVHLQRGVLRVLIYTLRQVTLISSEPYNKVLDVKRRINYFLDLFTKLTETGIRSCAIAIKSFLLGK